MKITVSRFKDFKKNLNILNKIQSKNDKKGISECANKKKKEEEGRKETESVDQYVDDVCDNNKTKRKNTKCDGKISSKKRKKDTKKQFNKKCIKVITQNEKSNNSNKKQKKINNTKKGSQNTTNLRNMVPNKKKNKQKIVPSTNYEENIDEDECIHDHTDYEMSYNEESNVQYWKDGASMSGINCRSCNGSFYDNLKCKPTTKTPAMTCKGREKYGCTYCLCYSCFSTKLIIQTM